MSSRKPVTAERLAKEKRRLAHYKRRDRNATWPHNYYFLVRAQADLVKDLEQQLAD